MDAVTSDVGELARIHMWFETDREALEVGLGMIGLTPPEQACVVRIKNTLHLTEIEVSAAMLEEVKENKRLKIASESRPMTFAADGNLPAF